MDFELKSFESCVEWFSLFLKTFVCIREISVGSLMKKLLKVLRVAENGSRGLSKLSSGIREKICNP